MATAPKIPLPPRPPIPFPQPADPRHNPLALWHLLSLDAPTVAALWTWFLARANHVPLPATSIAAMATAVWLLYAADRLLDARLLDARLLDARLLDSTAPGKPILEARHRFHHHHRRAFLIGIAAATLALAGLLPTLAPEAVRLYLIEGSFLIGYFLLIHATSSAHRLAHRVPKELAVGLFFAAATFIPTIARQPALRLPLLPPAILLAALCSLNCLFIYAWEHPRAALPNPNPPENGHRSTGSGTHPTAAAEAHPATRFALHHLRGIAVTVLLAATALALFDHRAPSPIPATIALATALLLTLDHYRRTLPATTLRAAADLALLTPLLFL